MYQRIVIKIGTTVLTNGTPHLNHPHLVELARQCAQLHQQGRELIICTSGAIAVGRAQLGFPNLQPTLSHKQMLAAVGQTRLMQLWERYFEIYGIPVGQILLTRADVQDRRRYLNGRDTLLALLEHHIIPIINENDAVATEEIKVGDNDNLSALVATLAEADLLILLTDQSGLFTADPRTHTDAQLIPEVDQIDESLWAVAGGTVSGFGVGGMTTKLQAADVARRAGAEVVIAAGYAPEVILRAVAGEAVGTHFSALKTPLENRKRWIYAGHKPSGSLIVDQGATEALTVHHRSLLPAGIVAVEGTFQRGDSLRIKTADGRELARGITRYSSHDLSQIAGHHSDKIHQILGYAYGAVAIHRSDMILL